MCFWCFSAQLFEVNIHRERVSHCKIYYHELNQGDIQFLMEEKDIPTFEQLEDVNINIFELSSSSSSLSPKYINKRFFEEEIVPLVYKNHFCSLTTFYNFVRKIQSYKHLCRRCLNTYVNKTKLEGHKLECIEQDACNKSYMHPNQKEKKKDPHKKRDPSRWIAADFECKNMPVDDNEVGSKNIFCEQTSCNRL